VSFELALVWVVVEVVGVTGFVEEAVVVESTHKDYYTSMTQLERETKEGIDWKKETRDQGM
jgi:hypothetical protein